eukprot:scaffold38790_cov214-Amphora_coffeaeformis.AAC.3
MTSPAISTPNDWNHSTAPNEPSSSSSTTLSRKQYYDSSTVATEAGTLSIASGSNSSVSSLLDDDNNEEPLKVSLWMLPPEDIDTQYQKEIDRLSTLQSDASGISFAPHVTIVGGILLESSSHEAVDDLIQTLRQGLKGFGPITCNMRPEVEFHTAYNAFSGQREAVWNQAAALPMEQTGDFLKLCDLSRKLLGIHNNNTAADEKLLWFPAPIHQPHMSLYYGRHGVPQARDIDFSSSCLPINFVTNRVALWKTSPSDNEQSVSEWRELAIFEL